MTARLIFPAICLSLALAGANAQETPKPAAPAAAKPAAGEEAKQPARETPPDQKAFNDIAKVTDPAKKIEALEKFKKDFPDSVFAQIADTQILSTMTSKMPDQTAKIRQQAQTMYKAAEAKDKEATKKDGLVTYNRRGSTAQGIAG